MDRLKGYFHEAPIHAIWGITGCRLDGLLELVDGTKKNGGHNGSVPLHAPG